MSQSKKKAAGAYKTPLTLLYAGIAAQAFGIAALALVSRRVLDEGKTERIVRGGASAKKGRERDYANRAFRG